MTDDRIPGLAERLRWARTLRKKTAAEVDREAGLSPGYTRAVELGDIADPGVVRIAKLAKYYGVLLDALIHGV